MGKSRKKSKRSHKIKTRDRVRKDDPSEPNPSSITKRICDFMTSDKAVSFSDVTLVSSDGVTFPALRALLIIRSPYFEKLFTSDFAEKNSSSVRISLHAAPLRHVLDYIYTDNCAMVRDLVSAKPKFSSIGCKLTLEIIELALAADYVEVQKLLQWCKDALCTEMGRKLHSLCIILEKLNIFNTAWSTELKEQALVSLIEDPEYSLLSNCEACDVAAGVLSLSEDTIEDIIMRITTVKDEMQGSLFQTLLVWTNGGYGRNRSWTEYLGRKPPVFIDPNQMELSRSPKLFSAKRIATLFDLTELSARTLFDVVEASGLCDAVDILSAYRHLALSAEKCRNVSQQGLVPVCDSSDANDEEPNEEGVKNEDDSDDSDDSALYAEL